MNSLSKLIRDDCEIDPLLRKPSSRCSISILQYCSIYSLQHCSILVTPKSFTLCSRVIILRFVYHRHIVFPLRVRIKLKREMILERRKTLNNACRHEGHINKSGMIKHENNEVNRRKGCKS